MREDDCSVVSGEVLKWDAPSDWKFINLYPVADWHYGAKGVPVSAMKKMAKMIKEDPFARWIGMGDLAENVTLGSKGDLFTQDPPPEAQIYTLRDLLTPIADKCVGFIGGNHGKRTLKTSGLDPDFMLANLMGIQKKYRRISMDLKMKVNEAVYLICAHHGRGGGATPGGKLNAMCKLGDVILNADLYIMGHNHETTFHPTEARLIRMDNGHACARRVRIRRYFTAAGSLHPYEGTYAEEHMYKPAPFIQMKLTLHGRKHIASKGKHQAWEEHEKRITREELFF